jgi:hypothetical protein
MKTPKATAVSVAKVASKPVKRVIKPKTPEVVEAAKKAVSAARKPEESRF